MAKVVKDKNPIHESNPTGMGGQPDSGKSDFWSQFETEAQRQAFEQRRAAAEYKKQQERELKKVIEEEKKVTSLFSKLKDKIKDINPLDGIYDEANRQANELEKQSKGLKKKKEGIISKIKQAASAVGDAIEDSIENDYGDEPIINRPNKNKGTKRKPPKVKRPVGSYSQPADDESYDEYDYDEEDDYDYDEEDEGTRGRRRGSRRSKPRINLGRKANILNAMVNSAITPEHESRTGDVLGSIASGVKAMGPIGKIAGSILDVTSKIFDAVVSARKAMDQYVDNAARVLSANVGKINAALEGTGKTYQNSLHEAVEGLGLNRFVDQTKYLSQIANLTTKGITFNVEQRALLETIKDQTINSFQAMQDSLLRLVRLTRRDYTAEQYGLQVALRNTLNSVFKDSTYLQGIYNSISDAITDAVMISGRSDVTEYSSIAQTWMGAMYESGINSSTVNKFANAINYLGSGNVQGLASDADMQRLVLLSMDTIGMDYADILQQGLSSSDITELMGAMVDYLSKIANNTEDNNVLQSSYTQLFGMSMADLQGFKNLQSMMHSLQYVNNATSLSVVEQELAKYQSDERVMMNEQIENIFTNAQFTMGSTIAKDSSKYLTWKISNLVVDLVDSVTSKGFMGNGAIGKAASKVIGAIGVGAEIALFAQMLNPMIETLKGIPSIFQSGEKGILQSYINAGATMGGSSTSNSSAVTTSANMIKSVNTLSSIQGATYQTAVSQYTDRDWDNPEEEKNETLEELKKITSALVVAKADEAHKALATYLVGMTDDTLRSFASIFADENAMQETFEGKNNTLKDNLFNFAGDKTSNSTKPATGSNNSGSSNSGKTETITKTT